MESKSKRARTFQGPGAAAGRDSEGPASLRSPPLALRFWHTVVSRYCYICRARYQGIVILELRLRLVSRLEHSGAEWWWWRGQVPFLLDPIADEDKEDGAR